MAKKAYQQKALNGFLYKSTYPNGHKFKIKTKIGDVELWGYKPEEYRALKLGSGTQYKVIGFTNLLPDSPVLAKDKFLIEINGEACSFAITPKPKKEVYLYLSVGKNRFVGLEDASIKEVMKTIKDEKKKKKEEKKKIKKERKNGKN